MSDPRHTHAQMDEPPQRGSAGLLGLPALGLTVVIELIGPLLLLIIAVPVFVATAYITLFLSTPLGLVLILVSAVIAFGYAMRWLKREAEKDRQFETPN